MGLSRSAIDRPVLTAVVAIITVIVGAIAYATLPVAQFPEVVPPTIVVSAQYPGANAEVVAQTVATVLEQEINGVDGMMYLYSQSTNDGRTQITVSFKIGADLDKAQVLVQNRVASAEARLPDEVRRVGVTTRRSTPDLLLVVHLISPDGTFDQTYISNYALLQVRDQLLRLDGVGDIAINGNREYSMRIWLDPDRIANLGLNPSDVVAAVRAENQEVGGGQIGQPPVEIMTAFQPAIRVAGRLTDPDAFGRIVIKTGADGRATHLSDVARVELAAQDYSINAYLSGQRAVAMIISQQPGSNALATAERIKATMAELSKSFPKGLAYRIAYNPTEFIAESMRELITTIFEAVALVVLVIVIFLQNWRAALIPIMTIPVSIVGTFAAMAALGYSVNNLTLFGLVLAVGIVVDDAIVVVENVERHLARGARPIDAARDTMDEVGGALVSIALVLIAVFIPTAFLPGITGLFYRQFAVTIAVATAISVFNSLTLSPAMAALLFRSHDGAVRHAEGWATRAAEAFNNGFARFARAYRSVAAFVVAHAGSMAFGYLALLGLTAVLLTEAPTGFVPALDQGYVILAAQLPDGASLSRTDAVMREVAAVAREVPGVTDTIVFVGFSGATRTSASNVGAIFTGLAPFSQRTTRALSGPAIIAELRRRLSGIQGAQVFVIAPPPVRGIGTTGGFSMRIEDRAGRGLDLLQQSTRELVQAAREHPLLQSVFSPFSANTPQIGLDIDRERAHELGVSLDDAFSTLQVLMGSTYVNDITLFGHVYRVTAQADPAFRSDPRTLARFKVRAKTGAMVPFGSFATLRDRYGPDRLPRYNLFPVAEISGDGRPGVSSGAAIAAMEELAHRILPDGIGFEWTDLSYQQTQAGNLALIIFPLSVLFVFLVLAANYESWLLPLSIILIVPMCLLSAITGILARGMDVNILTQIGFVVLIGLAAKNAVLIVEFAWAAEREGIDTVTAVVDACALRLRPIIMTSLAFVFGVIPLMIATGAGAEMRQAIGTTMVFGMLGVTGFGLCFTPAFYVLVRRIMGPVRRPVDILA